MKILVTGAKGFIGKNLAYALRNSGYDDILEFDVDTDGEKLGDYCANCDFVFHLAGINRPENNKEFKTGNVEFTQTLLDLLRANNNDCPIMYASSIQAIWDNDYGRSKKQAEDLILDYESNTGVHALIYRFPNIFGKWCRPNYNSAVATFCHNIANDLPIVISDRSYVMNLAYIDDVTAELIKALSGEENRDGSYCYVPVTYTEKLGVIADYISSFPDMRNCLAVPDQSNPLLKKLYATYLSYLPQDSFKYPLTMHSDNRGSFTEFLRTPNRGQVSVNVSKPGIVKGNHWHDSKHEKFLIVSGQGVVRFRKPDKSDIFEIHASSEKLEVIDIPPGYTHNLENTGSTDMVTLIWASEAFDPKNPDTHYLEV